MVVRSREPLRSEDVSHWWLDCKQQGWPGVERSMPEVVQTKVVETRSFEFRRLWSVRLRVPGRGFAGLNQHQARRNALLWHGWVVLCLAPVGQNLSDDSRELAGPGTRGSIWRYGLCKPSAPTKERPSI